MQGNLRSVVRAALATAVVFFLAAGSADADVVQQVSLTWPDTTAGQSNATASFTVTNLNDGQNQAESNTLDPIKLAPSCGTLLTPCLLPDLGVFALSGPWSGAAGTACATSSFSPSVPDVLTGGVLLTATPAVTLLPPGGLPGSDRCTVNLTFHVLRVPTFDADALTAGVQTASNLVVQSSSSGLIPKVTPQSALSTVSRATPALVTSAINATLGQPIRDTATVTSSTSAVPTGTVTFDLYGPTDLTCAAAPLFTSNTPLGAGGVATSGSFTPTVAGSYRWRARYLGDHDHLPLSPAACDEWGETSVVTRPQTALGVLFDASDKRLRASKRGRFTYSFLATPLRSGKIGLKSTKTVKFGSKRRFMKIAAKSFTAPATSQVTVTFKLSRMNLKALKRKRRLRFVVTATLDGKTFTTKLTLKRPKKY